MPVLPPDSLAREYYVDDVNQLADVARSPSGASTLHEATGGDPSSSPRWQANIGARRGPGAHHRVAHRVGRRVGRPRALPRAGSADVRPRRDRRSSARSPPCSARARGARCCSARRPSPKDRRRRACWCSPRDWELESATPGVERWMSDLPERRLGRGPAARRGARGRRAGAALGRRSRRARRGRPRARADPLGTLGRAARRHAGERRQPARRGDRRARPSRAHRARC